MENFFGKNFVMILVVSFRSEYFLAANSTTIRKSTANFYIRTDH